MGQADRTTSEGWLEVMPEPYRYWRTVKDGEVLVGFGPTSVLAAVRRAAEKQHKRP